MVGGPSRYYLNFHIRIVEDNLVLVPQYLLEDNLGTFLLWWSKVAQFSSYSELDTILITSSLNGLLEQVPRGGNEHEALVGREGAGLHRGQVGHLKIPIIHQHIGWTQESKKRCFKLRRCFKLKRCFKVKGVLN